MFAFFIEPPLAQAMLRVKHVDLIFPINCIWQQSLSGGKLPCFKVAKVKWKIKLEAGAHFSS